MMHGERAVARDHHDALEHGLVVERARLGGDGRFGVRNRVADGGAICSLIAATRSSGSVRLTATARSTKSMSPAGRTRTRSTATTPGNARRDRA